MLLDIPELLLKHDLHPTGVLHVGAHLAEEKAAYAVAGIPKVIWVEANGEVIFKLRDLCGEQMLIHALIADVDGRKETLHITNHDGMSSSIFNFGTHVNFSHDTWVVNEVEMETVTLDTLSKSRDFGGISMLNIDIEGAGLAALLGAFNLLQQITAIYIEVQTENVYDGAPLLPEYDEFLRACGFRRTDLYLVPGQGWGDAFYVRS